MCITHGDVRIFYRVTETSVQYRAEVFRLYCDATLGVARNVGWELLEGQKL